MALGHKTGGRRRGTPNHLTTDVRAMILKALNKAGGVNYLYTQSVGNPVAFMALVGRTLPKDVNVKATGDLVLSISLSGKAAPRSDNHL
jgi:hypothetical protein